MLVAKPHIGINRTVCVDARGELSSKEFIQQATRVLKRDKHTCRMCGFKSTKMQQVITANDKYSLSDFSPSNMLTVCPSCYAGTRLGISAQEGVGEKSRLTLIYMPEMKQSALNHLQRTISYFSVYHEMSTKQWEEEDELKIENIVTYIKSVGFELADRAAHISEMLEYSKMNSLVDITTMLYDLSDDNYKLRTRFFKDIRYILDNDYLDELMKKQYFNENFSKNCPIKGHEDSLSVLRSYTGYSIDTER